MHRRVLQLSENLVGDIRVRIDLLYVVQIFQHFEHFHHVVAGRITEHTELGEQIGDRSIRTFQVLWPAMTASSGI